MPQTDPHVSADLCALGIADLVDLIARREVSPIEMANASLARYEATVAALFETYTCWYFQDMSGPRPVSTHMGAGWIQVRRCDSPCH
jgi:hypothetical protein